MIELAYMSIEGITEQEREFLYTCVAPERREQLMARQNRLSADLSLAAEALARVMLCRTVRRLEAERLANGEWIPDDFPYSGGMPGRIQPKDFVIVRAENGKPYQGTVPGLFFNCSHSGTMVACGVAGEEIGVDIQKRTDGGRLREKVFCSEEMQEAESSGFFTEVWAKKESYLKLTGEGLRKELKSLNVCRMQTESQVQWHSEWVLDEYYLCACLENRGTYGTAGTLLKQDSGAAKGRAFRSCPVRPEEITEYIREVQEG